MDDKLGKILIVDDDENINELIDMYLKSSGYETKKCFNGLDACNIVTNDNIGLVLLDIMLPGKDGVEVLKFIRKQSNIPVIMLTAKGEVFDKVLALELGADDYITKPFLSGELLARINKILNVNKLIKVSNITIDTNKMLVLKDNQEINLTSLEYQLLLLLFTNLNKVVTRDKIIDKIFDLTGNDVYDNTITVYLKRIREKLGIDIIKTVKGIGYRIDEE